MNMSTKYIYQHSRNLIVENKKGEKIEFYQNDIFQFFPEIKSGKPPASYDVLWQRGKEVQYIKMNPELVQNILERTHKKTVDQSMEVFSTKNNEQSIDEIAHNILAHIQSWCHILEQGNLSANYPQIEKKLADFSRAIGLLEHDFTHPSVEQIEALSVISRRPETLKLSKENRVTSQDASRYIPEIEKVAQHWFNEQIHWLEKKDYSMSRAYINDFLDILKISHHLEKKNWLAAYEGTYLDTIVREQLPSSFWQEWVEQNNAQSFSKKSNKIK